MKLKLARLPSGNQGPLIVSVRYGGDDDGRGEKIYTESVNLNAVVSVQDDLGQAILAAYSKFFSIESDQTPETLKVATTNDGPVTTGPQNEDNERLIKTSKKSKDIQAASAAL